MYKNNQDQAYIAVRETGISWHYEAHGFRAWNLINEATETPQHSIVQRSLRGALNWALIMPRDASLSDSGCDFFQSLLWSTPLIYFRQMNVDNCVCIMLHKLRLQSLGLQIYCCYTEAVHIHVYIYIASKYIIHVYRGFWYLEAFDT